MERLSSIAVTVIAGLAVSPATAVAVTVLIPRGRRLSRAAVERPAVERPAVEKVEKKSA